MKTLAVIPARGGSKRIPRKNIISFHGKPLIAWTIEAAIKSQAFEKVAVYTDDLEIAKLATSLGASVPFLRKEYSDDHSHVSLATLSAVNRIERELGEQYSQVAQLMANCPLRNEHDIRFAMNNFEKMGASSQISCFRYGWMNPWWASKLDNRGHPTLLFPETVSARSQDLPPLYCPTGAIWIAKVDELRAKQTFHTEDRIFCEIPWMSAVDIDDLDDLKMAEALFYMAKSTDYK